MCTNTNYCSQISVKLHNIQVEIIINSWKQNNLHLSSPSNMQIISQEQLNVDIFSSQESWSGAAPRMRTSSQCLCCKYLQYLQYWQIFGHPNTMLDWRANSNIILHTNIRVCPNTVYSNAGFKNLLKVMVFTTQRHSFEVQATLCPKAPRFSYLKEGF